MKKKTLKAKDVERLENTSFATLQPHPGGILEINGGGDTCTCDCKTCTCCLPDYDPSDLCCTLPPHTAPLPEVCGVHDEAAALARLRGVEQA